MYSLDSIGCMHVFDCLSSVSSMYPTAQMYHWHVCSTGTLLLTVSATDADLGCNARLFYSLTPPPPTSRDTPTSSHQPISINSTTAPSPRLILSISRQRHSSPTVSLWRTAVVGACGWASWRHGVDDVTRCRTATTSLIIDVTDVNDAPPMFDRRSYFFSVSENLAPDARVGRVSATDTDLTPTFKRLVSAS